MTRIANSLQMETSPRKVFDSRVLKHNKQKKLYSTKQFWLSEYIEKSFLFILATIAA